MEVWVPGEAADLHLQWFGSKEDQHEDDRKLDDSAESLLLRYVSEPACSRTTGSGGVWGLHVIHFHSLFLRFFISHSWLVVCWSWTCRVVV